MRVSKDPEARKDELIETAERLFLEKGYDSTAVGDIVKAVGVAQGTFYYHFKSKEDVLGAIIIKSLEAVGRVITDTVNRTDLTAPEKLSAVIGVAFDTITGKQGLLESLHRPGNALIHDTMKRITIDIMVPLMARLVEEGKQDGDFDVPHPREAGELVLAAVAYSFDHPTLLSDPGHRARMKAALESALPRILGMTEGTISIGL
jgi:AcrR family transcriptional regulator